MLYQADWSAGLGGWAVSAGWKTLNGALLNDGTNTPERDGNATPSAIAPFRPGELADYSVEAEIQVVGECVYWCGNFGIFARSDGKGSHYAAGMTGPGDVYAQLSRAQGGYLTSLAQSPFKPGKTVHRYRLEAKGNVLRFLVDGAVIAEAIDNRFLSGGAVGLFGSFTQITVRSFRVVAL